MASTFQRIDTHHHIMPPTWLKAAGERIMASAIGIPRGWMFDWTPEVSIEAMDQFSIGVTIGSVSTPGVSFDGVAAGRALARECNEFGAKMILDHPTRFGIFAILPMPDVEGTLKEIEYSLDVLKLDGVCFMTNFGDTWPGDAKYREVFDELNRRKAVAFFHPHLLESAPIHQPDVPPAVLEYPFDSTRAIASLLYSGTFTRCPDTKYIFSHGGGALPFLAGRLASLSRRPTAEAKRLADMLPNGPEYELKRLYYDIPSATNTPAMAALLDLVPVENVLFGTDFPYLRADRACNQFDALKFSEADRAAILRRNAVRLMPRLAGLVAA